jgi:hypothetical protein
MRSLAACLLVLAGLGAAGATAEDAATPTQVLVAVVVDDLGNDLADGKRVAALPGPVACSILPLTAHAREIAELAHAAGKEVLLHLPLESVNDMPLGPGAVTLDMDETEIKRTVTDDLASLPHLAGLNNHEGSMITQHPGDMAWIMQAVHAAGKYFYVDSYTTVDSVAYQIAREQGVPAARRNVFLDDDDKAGSVEHQWQRLLKLARKYGFALAIGHPRPATLAVLEAELPKLRDQGVILVAVSRIVELQEKHPLPAGITAMPAASTLVKD